MNILPLTDVYYKVAMPRIPIGTMNLIQKKQLGKYSKLLSESDKERE